MNALEAVSHELKQLLDDYVQSLSNGAVEDFAEYKRQCGVIQGLRLALREIEDLAKIQEDDDD